MEGRESALHPGAIVREILAAKGWTQADLADVLGVALGTVGRLVNCRGGASPSGWRAAWRRRSGCPRRSG